MLTPTDLDDWFQALRKRVHRYRQTRWICWTKTNAYSCWRSWDMPNGFRYCHADVISSSVTLCSQRLWALVGCLLSYWWTPNMVWPGFTLSYPLLPTHFFLYASVLSQEIGWEERLRNDFLCSWFEVNILLAFLHWVGIALHPWPSVSNVAIFVLKGDVKLQLTNCLGNISAKNYQNRLMWVRVIVRQSSVVFWDTVYICKEILMLLVMSVLM